MRIFIFLICSAGIILSQNFGPWQNYTDMQNVKNISISNEKISAVTSGGMFLFYPADSSYLKLTKSEGLQSQNLTAVTQDAAGRIWIGSGEGFIHIYDPADNSLQTIRDIYASNKTQKSINYLTALGDTIFVATDFGISLIDAKSFIFLDTVLKFGSLPAETKVNSLFIKDRIYIATDLGLAISKANAVNLTAPESWTSYGSSDGLKAVKIFAIDYYGGIIAGTDRGIFKFDGNVWNKLIEQTFDCRGIAVDGGDLYFVTAKDTLETHTVARFVKYDGANVKTQFGEFDENYYSILNISNKIYISSSHGIMKIDGLKKTEIKPNGLVDNSVHRLAIDKESNLWTVSGKSSSGSGINFFDGKTWRNFNKTNTPGLGSNAFYGLYAAKDGRVFLGNWGQGFAIYENGDFQFFNSSNTNLTGIKPNLKYIVVTDLQLDDKNNLWITNSETAFSETMNMFSADGKEYNYRIGTRSIPVSPECLSMTIDQFNTKWFNVVSAVSGELGLYYFNENGTPDDISDDTWGVLNSNDGLNSNTVNDIALDKRGELWVCTSLGINIIPNPGNPTSRISSVFPVRQQNVITVTVDPLNRKWVGTNEGVFVLSSDGSSLIADFTKDNSPLPNNNIKSITINENNGMVYIGTDFGISALKSSSVKPNNTFGDLFVYPNPVYISNAKNNQVSIDGLIKETTLKILTISGNLVRDIVTPGGRMAAWDLRDESGDLVPSGIYLIVAYDAEANNVATIKLAVLRN